MGLIDFHSIYYSSFITFCFFLQLMWNLCQMIWCMQCPICTCLFSLSVYYAINAQTIDMSVHWRWAKYNNKYTHLNQLTWKHATDVYKCKARQSYDGNNFFLYNRTLKVLITADLEKSLKEFLVVYKWTLKPRRFGTSKRFQPSLMFENMTRGRIFSCVWPFYEWVVSDLGP
jgi:hypothetical protein